ncbi:hypothetical protein V1224_09485 [Lachnospiraceae bacterium JLR.KK008]
MGARESEDLALQNRELRVSKNMLIDKVEEQEQELKSKNMHIADMEQELLHIKSELRRKEKEQKKEDQREKNRRLKEKIDRFFDRLEGFLFRTWLSFWALLIIVVVSTWATIMFNEDLRESVTSFFWGLF